MHKLGTLVVKLLLLIYKMSDLKKLQHTGGGYSLVYHTYVKLIFVGGGGYVLPGTAAMYPHKRLNDCNMMCMNDFGQQVRIS